MVSQEIEIKATPKDCFEVITDYQSYPEFLKDLEEVTVKNKRGHNCEVTYHIRVIKPITYTLKMQAWPYQRVEWSFVKGDVMKDNHGFWELKEIKKGLTCATYNIDIKFGLLVPKAITRMLVDKNLPAMLDSFKKRIERCKASRVKRTA